MDQMSASEAQRLKHRLDEDITLLCKEYCRVTGFTVMAINVRVLQFIGGTPMFTEATTRVEVP
jgi:hypothetical protein